MVIQFTTIGLSYMDTECLAIDNSGKSFLEVYYLLQYLSSCGWVPIATYAGDAVFLCDY